MPEGVKIRLNGKGIREILFVEAAPMVNQVAQEMADKINSGRENPIATVQKYTTDRRAASVGVPAIYQARDGELTRAAAAMGLEVTS